MPLYMPELYEERATRQMTSVFGGLNRGARIPDGEWADMKNLTSDQYPLMATRDKRHHSDNRCCPTAVTVRSYRAPLPSDASVLGKYEGVIWLDGVFLRFGGKRTVNLFMYGLNEDDAPKQKLLNFGAYIIVYPAMIYVNTVDMEDVGRIEDDLVIESTKDKQCGVRISPTNYEMDRVKFRGKVFPEKTNSVENGDITLNEGDLWYNQKMQNYKGERMEVGLYVYVVDGEEGRWVKEKDYIYIERIEHDADLVLVSEIALSFKKELCPGDTIAMYGIENTFQADGVDATVLGDGNRLIQNVKYDSTTRKTIGFCIEGLCPNKDTVGWWEKYADSSAETCISFSRPIPRMDYMCEADNRLWGCRYGEDGNGNFVNEIYASARGDFFRWIQGAADNDDSPVTFSIGTDGPWTGCVNYGGAPTFFKERCMHRIGGYGASGFYVQDTPVRGVMSGASDSLAVVNGVLYYYADGAVMAYDGSLPVSVSEKLSPLWKYKRAVGGALYGKYYLSLYNESSKMIDDDKGQKMRQPPSKCALYVLDTERGLWHKEDDVEITCMATGEDDLVFVKVGEETVKNNSGVSYRRLTYTLSSICGTAQLNHNGDLGANAVHDWSPEETKSIGWSATSGIIGLETPDKKYLSKISIRLCLSESDGASAWVEYDSEEGWKPVGNVPQTNRMRTVTLPIIPKRCDHMRLMLEGTGNCKVYSITKTFTEAEDE